ncbi:MAG TPA: 5'/3'-nucleotidase SurE [Burkholderiales bacterium]|jgi:5'-nucleotidase
MRILITNDDGVYSPGIAALAQVASRFGEVRIVAPDVEMSSASHSITASRPVTYKRTPLPGLDAYRVNGTPGDCVMLGTTLWEKVDLVLSGINIGTNLGNAVWHSGTLAGAKQAALLGLRGIAFSAPATDREQPSFEALKPWVATVLEALLEAPDMPLVNVNFPAEAPRGTHWTRQSMRHYDGKVVPAKDPMGRTHYWFTVVPVEATEEGTDRWAIEQRYVSITPLRLDLTDQEKLAEARKVESWKKLKFA